MSSVQKLCSAAATILTILLLQTGDAHAWVKVCNFTGKIVSVMHVHRDTQCGTSCADVRRMNGWYNIGSGSCQTVYSGLARLSMYMFAQRSDGVPVWSGNTSIRTWTDRPNSFCACKETTAYNIACLAGSCPTRKNFNFATTPWNQDNATVNLH